MLRLCPTNCQHPHHPNPPSPSISTNVLYVLKLTNENVKFGLFYLGYHTPCLVLVNGSTLGASFVI